MLPSIFGENLFDDSLSDFFDFGRMMPQVSSELYGKHARNLMKTDVRELDGSYELDVDLPGFKKDEVTVDLQDGYLTISAATVSYTHLRAHETEADLVCRLLLEKIFF